jgi:hypothetical protein
MRRTTALALASALALCLALSACEGDDTRDGDTPGDLPGDTPGDTNPAATSCAGLDAPVIAACLTRADASGPEPGPGMERYMEATVDAVVDGRRANGCMQRYWYIVGHRTGDAANEHAILLTDDDGVQWAVEVALPGAPRPGIGQRVTVDVAVDEPYFGPLEGHVDVRITDDRRLWWIGQAGAVDRLEPPTAFRFRRGDAVCGDSFEHCGAWLGYDVIAAHGDRTVDVPYGGTAAFDDMDILHGRVEGQIGTTTPCIDWFHALAILAVTWDGQEAEERHADAGR